MMLPQNLDALDDGDIWEDLFARAPEEWDGDEAAIAILIRYVHHLEEQVERNGGCLLPWCHNEEGETCTHGYLT